MRSSDRTLHNWLSVCCWTGALAAAAATLGGLLDRLTQGDAGWIFDLLAHFPRHIGLASLLLAVISSAAKIWRPAAISAATAALNIALTLGVSGYALPHPTPSDGRLIRIVSGNVHENRAALKRLAELARAYDATLVATYETPVLSQAELRALFPQAMTLRLQQSASNGQPMSSRILLASGFELGEIDPSPVGEHARVVMRYSIPIAGAPVQARSVHTVSPDRPDLMRDRNALLAATDDGLDQTKPFVVFGDFNTSPWAAAFRSLPGARAGDPRFEATFPAQALLLGLPIDHIMFGGGLSLREYHVGPDIGSDHLPLFATFSLPVR